jgi:acetyl-CoA acetyltransferase
MEKYGSTAEHFAKIAYKNHKHSVNNPFAQVWCRVLARLREVAQAAAH